MSGDVYDRDVHCGSPHEFRRSTSKEILPIVRDIATLLMVYEEEGFKQLKFEPDVNIFSPVDGRNAALSYVNKRIAKDYAHLPERKPTAVELFTLMYDIIRCLPDPIVPDNVLNGCKTSEIKGKVIPFIASVSAMHQIKSKHGDDILSAVQSLTLSLNDKNEKTSYVAVMLRMCNKNVILTHEEVSKCYETYAWLNIFEKNDK